MKKNKFKRVLSIALATVMVAGTIAFTPQGTSEVQATTATVKNINLGTGGFSAPTSTGSNATTWTGSKVYYGNKLWRVLDPNHDSNGTGDSAFLFSEELQDAKAYNDRYVSITWADCSLRTYLNGFENTGGSGTFLSDTFTTNEQSAINKTTVKNPDNSSYGASGGRSTQDKLFLLSLGEVQNANYGFGNDAARAASSWWWLRSPGYDAVRAAYVNNPNGNINWVGTFVNDNNGSVRPAFNLNLNSVLFSSASDADKSSFASVGTDKVSPNTWKLTLKDTSKTVSVTSGQSVTQSGQTITVPYTYTGSDVSQISIMITDKAYTESDASILYYGALDTTLALAGTGTFTLPSSLPVGYKIYMMAEDVNEGNLTDYSSTPVEINRDVTIINPASSHITLSTVAGNGAETQTGLIGAMTSVVYKADDGYYFPETYTVSGSNGITVSWNSYTQITVSGNPTATATITLIAATEKESQAAPSVTDGVDKITGTTTAMEYASSESATTWETCGDGNTTVAAGTWYVRYAATDTKKPGVAARVVVTTTPSTYAVTVNNGTGYGSYAAGATVTITADEAPSGQEFDKWTVVSGGVTLASATSVTTTFKMPANAVEVTAIYKNVTPPAPSTYVVTVNKGTGDGSYAAGGIVTITADEAPSGQEFDKWTIVSGGVTLASATSVTTTFKMPANAVEVTATYKNKSSDSNPPAPTPTYTIIAGAGGTHELSTAGTIRITCDGALDKLTGIYVDDNLVDAANYTLKSGSTILTLKAAYLNTLSVGTHKVKFQYRDGSAESTFVIKEASTQDTTQETTTPSEKDEAPKTGDSTPIAWLFIIAVVSGVGIVYFDRKKKTVK